MEKMINASIEEDIATGVADKLEEEVGKLSPKEVNNEQPELILYDSQKPGLSAGKYTISITQQVSGNDINQPDLQHDIELRVEDPPQHLTPPEIHQVFPPKGAFGKFGDFLPHIVLNQSTLPWQATHHNDITAPWLALIVMDEDEIERDETEEGSSSFIFIQEKLLPSAQDIRYLTHVQKRRANVEAVHQIKASENVLEKSVVIANRFPTEEKNNTVFLVALNKKPIEVEGPDKKKKCKVNVLHHWSFTCKKDERDDLEKLFENLKVGAFRLPPLESIKVEYEAKYNNGFVALPHQTRNGLKVMSWYRGPFIPKPEFTFQPKSEDKKNKELKVIYSSDHLIKYSQKTRRLMVLYAAAWELGKWLTLQNKEVSVGFFKWKRRQATRKKIENQERQGRQESEETETPSLKPGQSKRREIMDQVFKVFNPSSPKETEAKKAKIKEEKISLPNLIKDWLMDLLLLRHIPFSYLVPDERLLPEESVRFFTIDQGWLWALLDGALSIGRSPVSRGGQFSVKELHLSGCLIRSKAIRQYPDLRISPGVGFQLLEKRLLGKDVWLCIFKENGNKAEVVNQVELFLPATGMRFGLDDNQEFLKKDGKVLDIKRLVEDLRNKNLEENTAAKSAFFAKTIMKKSSKIIFKPKKE